MGLTRSSVGGNIGDDIKIAERKHGDDKIVALCGNPNVGKSTVFNALTGMHQHTGNWPGKTVSNAEGYCEKNGRGYVLVDIPGTYSLSVRSPEEEVARDFLCFGGADYTCVVCDATCLERNLNLALQVIEITPRVVLCLNLIDEAKSAGIYIDGNALSRLLGVPVIMCEARKKKGVDELLGDFEFHAKPHKYCDDIEAALKTVLDTNVSFSLSRFFAVRFLCGDESFCNSYILRSGATEDEKSALLNSRAAAYALLFEKGIDITSLEDMIAEELIHTAEKTASAAVCGNGSGYTDIMRRADKLMTNKFAAFPIMFLLLAVVFWITIRGANYPSEFLSAMFSSFEKPIYSFLSVTAGIGEKAASAAVFGIYRVLTWVVSVMLPPMAIFFPLFTLLEDFGFLPRISFCLDRVFCACGACGKQSLTTCMGFGCNAAGVIGCRIIDSPRERLIAMLTNAFVPCNGRFPAMIAVISLFFVSSGILSAFFLASVIVFGVLMSLLASKLLASTLLSGVPSSFTLELPPYRRPQIGKVIIRSVFDRTLFVLGRAATVAAPAGLIIWIAANVYIGGASILSHISGFLDPLGRLLGLDGIILTAFILGFPANEIVLPIVLMAYGAGSTVSALQNTASVFALLTLNGWTLKTAVCFILFSLMHWPCSTTLMTVKKESQSVKYTLVAAFLPTLFGFVICFLAAHLPI